MRKLLVLILILAIAWAAGLLAFVERVQGSTPADPPPSADGIVVLTGGSNLRLVEAMRLLEMGKAKRLLVSGVNPMASRADIRDVSKASGPLYNCCVDLGFQAANTIGNAHETAGWVKAKHFSSLIVVTADFHMPRALVEIHAASPGLRLIPYPVATAYLDANRWWDSSEGRKRMLGEYDKYLASFAGENALRLLHKIDDRLHKS